MGADGHSLLPLLQGEPVEPWDVFAESHAEGVFGSCFMLRRGPYKYVYILHAGGEDEQLFDLRSDPDEWHNVAGEAAYADVVAELKAGAPRLAASPRNHCDMMESPTSRILLPLCRLQKRAASVSSVVLSHGACCWRRAAQRGPVGTQECRSTLRVLGWPGLSQACGA